MLQRGLPVELHVVLKHAIDNMLRFEGKLKPAALDHNPWECINLGISEVEGHPEFNTFQFGTKEPHYPLMVQVFPANVELSDVAESLLEVENPQNFFQPTLEFSPTTVIDMVYVAWGGDKELKMDGFIAVAVGALALSSRLPTVTDVHHGYDAVNKRYALYMRNAGQSWLWVLKFAELRPSITRQ
ncbi:hypothetical protein [Xanthomonas phage RTH11]|nr:hypothetical protein [Xanthomonas phage RTH11]